MSDSEYIRTPCQIIDEFAKETASIMSGTNARTDKHSGDRAEIDMRIRIKPNPFTRGIGHSYWACTGGRNS